MVKLDETLSIYQGLVFEMASKVRAMHCMALEILENGDRSQALDIIKSDEFVNHYEEEINDRAQDVLALLSPVATDLRIVIAGIKAANDLERIADYAKNIAQYVIKYGAIDGWVLEKAKLVGQVFLTMFDHTMEAYQDKDVKRAYEIPYEDLKINELFNEMTTTLQSEVDQHRKINSVIQMVVMLRNFERAGDHTKNICEHLIYQEKGQHLDFD